MHAQFQAQFPAAGKVERRLLAQVRGEVEVLGFEGVFIASTNLMEALDAASLRRIERLDCFTLGDMANALRQLRVLGQVPEVGVLLDLVEGELRLKPGGARAAMGFLA